MPDTIRPDYEADLIDRIDYALGQQAIHHLYAMATLDDQHRAAVIAYRATWDKP